jgi:hypothetical protein
MVREKPAADFIVRDTWFGRLNRSLRDISAGGLRDGEFSLRQLRTNVVLCRVSPNRLLGNSVWITIIVYPTPIGESEDSSTKTFVAVMAVGREIDENGRVPAN